MDMIYEDLREREEKIKTQQRLQRIKTKTSLIVSFTSQMVALIRFFGKGGVGWFPMETLS